MSRSILAAFGLALLLLGGCGKLPDISLPKIAGPKPPPPAEPEHMIVDTAAGRVLASRRGMTLYVSATDTVPDVSTCDAACAADWPPLVALDDAKPAGEWSVVQRTDGLKQWAYGGKPLHGWRDDKKPGDALGDGRANGRWRAATADIGTEAYASRMAAMGEGRAPCEGIVHWDKIRFETVHTTRQVADEFDSGDIRLATYLYRPAATGRVPVVIYNHGSLESGAIPVKMRMFPACEIIRFFTDRGYAVAAPNRRGRGESTGTYVEECEGCSPTQYYSRGARGLDEAIRDLDTVVSALAATPDIDSSRIMMTGPSRGGFLSVIYAAERPQRIWSIVNFAGGWFSTRDNDPKENLEFNVGNLRRAGMNAQVTMLWLYRDMDRRHSTQSIRRFYDGYRELGGNAVLRLYTNEPGKDGHNLMFEPALWSDEVRAFLDQLR